MNMPINDESLPTAYVVLRDYLMTTFNAKRAAGGRECVIRCPYCGDSRDTRSAHLYVGYNRRRGTISYNCFKCGTNGDVGVQFFRTLGIFDTNIMNMVLEFNANRGAVIYSDSHKSFRNSYNAITRNSIIPVKDTPEYLKKLDYINRRIGGSLTLHDIQSYKIILNLLDFLSANSITTYSRHMSIMEQLAFGFIGFLSVDSTHVTMRRLVPENKVHESLQKRYTNYTINENGTQIYCIRESIDPSRPNAICVAEGPFDILSLHYNFFSPFMNKIMFASCGKGLEQVIRYLIYNKGMSLFNSVVHLFIDNDITSNDMMNYQRILSSIGIPYVIHRNEFSGEKDYGIPKDRIRDSVIYQSHII